MKPGLAFVVLLTSIVGALGSSSINVTNKYAYGANLGWISFRGDTNNGAVIGEYVCSGYLYSADVGWISLGNGAPANGIQYQNNSSTDFGVNQDGLGNLRGLAYGANIGWINFESNGAPRVDLLSGMLSGSVYSANCGWISLSNGFAVVQTDTIVPGADSNANGLPDAWERTYFGSLGVDPNADPDQDGMSNKEEHLAGTSPTNALDNLQITDFATDLGGTAATLTWRSVPTRYYLIQETTDLDAPLWSDSGLGLIPPGGPSTSRSFGNLDAPQRFYRVQAVRPLAP